MDASVLSSESHLQAGVSASCLDGM
jgi:hypothetical protein